MSIFRLRKTSGTESEPQEWANNKVFPDGENVDLIDEVGGIGLSIEDIIGIQGGECYEDLKAKIVDGWKLNNGSRDYFYYEALNLITSGVLGHSDTMAVSKTIVSHDLCQPITWFQNSSQVIDEILRKVDDYYEAAHKNLICLKKGFMYQEDIIPHQEIFNIKVNDIVVSDTTKFSINPVTGKVTFEEGFIENPGTDIVKMSYEYADSSIFEVQTDADYMWRILKTEIQLDSKIVIDNPIVMEVVIDHPLAGDNYIASKWVYKNVRDFISGSNLGFSVPAFGGTSEKAGVMGDIIILPFNYSKPMSLPVNMNARIRLRIENDIAPEGKFGTVTFYMDKIKL